MFWRFVEHCEPTKCIGPFRILLTAGTTGGGGDGGAVWFNPQSPARGQEPFPILSLAPDASANPVTEALANLLVS